MRKTILNSVYAYSITLATAVTIDKPKKVKLMDKLKLRMMASVSRIKEKLIYIISYH
jgi:hypothetical protein